MQHFFRTTFFALSVCLFLGGCGSWPPIIDSSRDIQRLASTTPSVRARGLQDGDVSALARLRELRTLDFGGGHGVMRAAITDEGLARLAAVDLPKLETLTLGYCPNISDAGLAHLGQMPTVTWLSLMACPQVTDAGLAHLLKMRRLTALDLRGCPGITDRGLEILAAKKDWQTILLGGCPNITAAGVTRLQNKLPRATVTKDDKEWSYHQ